MPCLAADKHKFLYQLYVFINTMESNLVCKHEGISMFSVVILLRLVSAYVWIPFRCRMRNMLEVLGIWQFSLHFKRMNGVFNSERGFIVPGLCSGFFSYYVTIFLGNMGNLGEIKF